MNNKILYVDDEPINLQLFKDYFGYDYTILIAESGPIGLEILAVEKDIRLVISDMRMPSMNGVEFLKQAKMMNNKISCIIFTGYDIDSEIQWALSSGLVQTVFRKPMDADLIERELAIFFRR